jgi:hypothetical protein
MNDVQGISENVSNGMEEITRGTDEIAQGMTHLNEVSKENSRQIDELSQTVSPFKVDASRYAADEQPLQAGEGEPAEHHAGAADGSDPATFDETPEDTEVSFGFDTDEGERDERE